MTNREALRQAYETIKRTQGEIRDLMKSTGYMACFHHHYEHPVFSIWTDYESKKQINITLYYDNSMKLDTELYPHVGAAAITLIESWLDQEIGKEKGDQK